MGRGRADCMVQKTPCKIITTCLHMRACPKTKPERSLGPPLDTGQVVVGPLCCGTSDIAGTPFRTLASPMHVCCKVSDHASVP